MANTEVSNFGNFDAFTALTNSQVNGNLPSTSFQPDATSTTPNIFGNPFGAEFLQPIQQPSLSQCPITKAQCEQLLNYLKLYSVFGSGNGIQTSHQAASVMTSMMPFVASQPSFTVSSSISSPSSNFLGNPFWFPPNLSHSIFSTQIVNRHEFKSYDWIIDTRATDHMVHFVS